MITLNEAKLKLEALEAFNAGNLTAYWVSNGTMMGTYKVFSYSTEIASLNPNRDKWVTSVKYSVTTSKHTNIIKKAWGI